MVLIEENSKNLDLYRRICPNKIKCIVCMTGRHRGLHTLLFIVPTEPPDQNVNIFQTGAMPPTLHPLV